MKVTHGIARGETPVSAIHRVKHLTMLLGGLTCTSVRHEDGHRQIYAFHYPGDFVGLECYIFPDSKDLIEVEWLATCSIGTIDYESVDQILQRRPALGLALWRAAMIEANISRQRLVTMRRPALQRVAHLLCEQLARRVALGIDNDVIPLSQIEVADAAGLSAVHTNRIFQELRGLGVLSKNRQTVEVVNKEHLKKLAAFDGRYLNPESLSRWEVRLVGSIFSIWSVARSG
jgi:CRP-like cAMP-binding protein